MTVQDAVAVQALAARLSPDFNLGVASAAFQIEGSLAAGGRGPSGWDAFAEKPGSILDGHSPAVACDHYNRVGRRRRADARARHRLLPLLHLLAADPAGRDRAVQQRGPGLLRPADRPAAGSRHLPHGHPVPLGHAAAPGTPRRLDEPGDGGTFAEYSAAAGRRFGDRVAQWVTLNEPASVTLNGYALGRPCARAVTCSSMPCPSVHHQLLGHGLAVQALRAAGRPGAVGVTNLHSPVRPASRSLTDRLLAKVFDLVLNRVYADPILLGRYPGSPLLAEAVVPFAAGGSPTPTCATIHQPLDFYGLNYYYPVKVAAGRGPRRQPRRHRRRRC